MGKISILISVYFQENCHNSIGFCIKVHMAESCILSMHSVLGLTIIFTSIYKGKFSGAMIFYLNFEV